MLKKIGILFFPIIIFLVAIGLGVSAGYVSVTGMAKTFPGAGITMIILMTLIESGKFVATTWLHRNSKNHDPEFKKIKGFLNRLKAKSLNIIVTIMVVIVMAITSFGIYGFLSHGYMATANDLEKTSRKISLIDKKIESKKESIISYEEANSDRAERIKTLSNQRKAQEVRLDTLYERRWWRSINETRRQIDDANKEIKVLTQKNSESDSIVQILREELNNLEIEKVEVSNNSSVGEVGPLLYISNITGYPMDHIVNYLILIIMFVFDPFAIVLLLAANKSLDESLNKIKSLNSDKKNKIKENEVENIDLEEKKTLTKKEEGELEKKEDNNKNIIQNENVIYSGSGEEEDVKEKVEEFFKKKEQKDKEFVEKIQKLNEKVSSETKVEDTENEDKIKKELENKKNSIYLKFLDVLYDGGKLKPGDHMSTFQELKDNLTKKGVRYNKRDLEDFLVICNLLHILRAEEEKRVILKDYDVAKILVSQI